MFAAGLLAASSLSGSGDDAEEPGMMQDQR